MKKRLVNRKMRLFRPVDGLLPLAWLAGFAMGLDTIKPGWIFFGWFAARLCGLFTADAVRMAYATQPGRRSVRGSTTLALLMQIVGAAIACGVYAGIFHGITPFTLCIFATGMLLNIEHVFYEYLYAAGDKYSAGLCAVLTAALLGGGMCVEQAGLPWFTVGASGLSALIALIAACAAGFRPGAMNGQVFRCAPRAMVYGIFYPAIALGGVLLLKQPFGWVETVKNAAFGGEILSEAGMWTGFYLGCAVYNLCRTAFRRSSMEARGLNISIAAAIILPGGLWTAQRLWGDMAAGLLNEKLGTVLNEKVIAAACTGVGILPEICFMVILSAIASLILWGNLRRSRD